MFIVPATDLCSTSRLLIVCVDGPGSLSGSAFNQLEATINKVLTILYLRKVLDTVSLYMSPAKSSYTYSRCTRYNIKQHSYSSNDKWHLVLHGVC